MPKHKTKSYRHKNRFSAKSYQRAVKTLRLKPGADARLKKIFASIGVPSHRPFKPDSFQRKAIKAIQQTDCLVTAPTGAGKTWIALQAIQRILNKQQRAWYACPLKALSNAKLTEFSNIFGADQVGILTGDRKENPDAPLIVGTTEILRNQLYDAMHRGQTVDTHLVVLDEAHFLGDPDRGVVWEEIMIYLPARVALLMLSATIGNAHQIANWLESNRQQKCIVVVETKRPVPLFPLFLHPTGTLLPLLSRRKDPGGNKIDKKIVSYLSSKKKDALRASGKLPPLGQIIRVMRKYNLLPAIFFLKSRSDCDQALEQCGDPNPSIKRGSPHLSQRIQMLTAHSALLAKHRQRRYLEHLAIGAHHSGQLPAWKLVIEKLMSEGLLDAVFATSTVAAGVNFPARTVVFLNSDRFNGAEFLPLTATEFHQMTGRAGRRGMDNIGFALAVPGKFLDIRWIAKLINSPPTDVLSQIKINFSMVLNLLLSHSPDQIQELLRMSFASHLVKQSASRKQKVKNQSTADDLWQDFLRHLAVLQAAGYVSYEGQLTADGQWASQLRVDQPLLIGEGFRKSAIPTDDPAILAALIASFVYERSDDSRLSRTHPSVTLVAAFHKLKKELTPFAKFMAHHGFAAKILAFKPVMTVFAWASGKPWEQVCHWGGIEEGDLAMLIVRTADNLRHIRGLRHVFPQAAAAADRAIKLILRDPITEDMRR